VAMGGPSSTQPDGQLGLSLGTRPIAAARPQRTSVLLAVFAAAGLAAVALAAELSWLDWRWVLIALAAASVLVPCGILTAQGKLDLFEPLTWFAVMFLILWVVRPAWDLAHQDFIYQQRLISPTFTKMLVAGLLAGSGFVIGYHLPAVRSLAARAP